VYIDGVIVSGRGCSGCEVEAETEEEEGRGDVSVERADCRRVRICICIVETLSWREEGNVLVHKAEFRCRDVRR
jgi:hypothetical protein